MAGKKLTFNSVEVADELPTVVRACTQEDIWRNAAGSLDFNPVHTDPEWVRTAQPFGIPQTVAHGMMTMSAMASVLSDWAYPVQGKIRSMNSKFIKPVPLALPLNVLALCLQNISSGGERILWLLTSRRKTRTGTQ